MGDITIRKLGWAEHIIRMDDERNPIKVLNWKFHNTRPRTKWEDIQKDTSRILGITEWRRCA